MSEATSPTPRLTALTLGATINSVLYRLPPAGADGFPLANRNTGEPMSPEAANSWKELVHPGVD